MAVREVEKVHLIFLKERTTTWVLFLLNMVGKSNISKILSNLVVDYVTHTLRVVFFLCFLWPWSFNGFNSPHSPVQL